MDEFWRLTPWEIMQTLRGYRLRMLMLQSIAQHAGIIAASPFAQKGSPLPEPPFQPED